MIGIPELFVTFITTTLLVYAAIKVKSLLSFIGIEHIGEKTQDTIRGFILIYAFIQCTIVIVAAFSFGLAF